MKKAIKIISIFVLITAIIAISSVCAFAQTKTLSYSTSGGEIIAKADITFKNSGFKQTNTIKITNKAEKDIYILVDGRGYYLSSKSSHTIKYNAYLGVTTTTKISIQTIYKNLSRRDIEIVTSNNGTIKFTKTVAGSKVK